MWLIAIALASDEDQPAESGISPGSPPPQEVLDYVAAIESGACVAGTSIRLQIELRLGEVVDVVTPNSCLDAAVRAAPTTGLLDGPYFFRFDPGEGGRLHGTVLHIATDEDRKQASTRRLRVSSKSSNGSHNDVWFESLDWESCPEPEIGVAAVAFFVEHGEVRPVPDSMGPISHAGGDCMFELAVAGGGERLGEGLQYGLARWPTAHDDRVAALGSAYRDGTLSPGGPNLHVYRRPPIPGLGQTLLWWDTLDFSACSETWGWHAPQMVVRAGVLDLLYIAEGNNSVGSACVRDVIAASDAELLLDGGYSLELTFDELPDERKPSGRPAEVVSWLATLGEQDCPGDWMVPVHVEVVDGVAQSTSSNTCLEEAAAAHPLEGTEDFSAAFVFMPDGDYLMRPMP